MPKYEEQHDEKTLKDHKQDDVENKYQEETSEDLRLMTITTKKSGEKGNHPKD
jgi:hypothetical protein